MNYIDQLRDKKLNSTKNSKETRKDQKKELSVFYEKMSACGAHACEECGKSLGWTISFHPRAHIAHIVPKSPTNGCPSVATNEYNVFYGCKDCHDGYDHAMDNHDYDSVKKMRIFPLLLARVGEFFHLIPQEERRRVPEILIP